MFLSFKHVIGYLTTKNAYCFVNVLSRRTIFLTFSTGYYIVIIIYLKLTIESNMMLKPVKCII